MFNDRLSRVLGEGALAHRKGRARRGHIDRPTGVAALQPLVNDPAFGSCKLTFLKEKPQPYSKS